ncbi:MAG: GAF domain-containing protein, partial [Bacteroidota bacterium]
HIEIQKNKRPIPSTRKQKRKGVCVTSWERAETFVVPDVEKFPGHIACSSLSRSEIVVPLLQGETVWGVLDVDSEALDQFDAMDKVYLERITQLISPESI